MTLFKEYKKKSISDPRKTFEAIVYDKLNEFDELMIKNSLENNNINKEKIDFLLDVAPFINEYYHEESYNDNDNKQEFENVSGMNNFVVTQQSSNRKGAVYEKYIRHIGDSNVCEINKSDIICDVCNVNKIFDSHESSAICPECGKQSHTFDTHMYQNENTYQYNNGNDQQSEVMPIYAYKRSNHFSEWLSQLQGKETTHIPETVYDSLREELKKERVIDPENITHAKIRAYLKKLRLNKYYEHIPHIIQKLKGVSPPKIKPEIEETLRQMFYLIQEPFRIHCPKQRKNFLSYSYTLYKMSELLGEDDMLEKFTLPLLKSRDKLSVQDKIWKGICSELNWEFIPTI